MSFKGRDQKRVRVKRLSCFRGHDRGACESKEVDEF